MRRSLVGVVSVGTFLLAACGEQSNRPTAPRLLADGSGGACSAIAFDTTSIINGIDALFDGGNQTAALSKFENIEALVGPTPPGTQPDTAQAHAIDLIGYALKKYQQGSLLGGQSAATQAQLVALIDALLCYTGLPPSFGVGNLGNDGAWALIYPITGDTDVVTGSKWAGTHLDTASVSVPTLLTITRLHDSPGPLLTQLDQYPLYYEFHVTPAGSIIKQIIVGVCQAADAAAPDPTRLRLAHNVAPFTMGSIEILPVEPAPFLDCTDAPNIAMAPGGNPLFEFAQVGWRTLRPVLSSLFLPDRLMAFATSGVGGTTRNFSPFGAVDTLLFMTNNSPLAQVWTLGGSIPTDSLPSVKILTPQGHPVDTLPVTFAVTPGGGSITGASSLTDASGIATVGSWTLGTSARVNTVSATPTPPHLRSGVQPNSLSFTAIAAASMFAYAGNNQTATEGTAVAVPPAVKVVDSFGQGVPGVTVTFTVQNGGASVTGAVQVTDANGIATVGSWTLVAGTNYLFATASVPNLAGSPVVFTATGAAAPPLVSCVPSNGTGDPLTRAFYWPLPRRHASTIKGVDVYLSSNAPANAATYYTVQLIASANGFGASGRALGTSTVTEWPLSGTASQNIQTHFEFSPALQLQSGDTAVTFSFRMVNNPSGATVTFNTGSCGLGDTKCKYSCPLIETNDASGVLSTFRRKGCGANIYGN